MGAPSKLCLGGIAGCPMSPAFGDMGCEDLNTIACPPNRRSRISQIGQIDSLQASCSFPLTSPAPPAPHTPRPCSDTADSLYSGRRPSAESSPQTLHRSSDRSRTTSPLRRPRRMSLSLPADSLLEDRTPPRSYIRTQIPAASSALQC